MLEETERGCFHSSGKCRVALSLHWWLAGVHQASKKRRPESLESSSLFCPSGVKARARWLVMAVAQDLWLKMQMAGRGSEYSGTLRSCEKELNLFSDYTHIIEVPECELYR